MSGSTGVTSKHPLEVRLRETVQKLQSITETDKSMLNASDKSEAYIKGFYEGAIQNGTLAAKLINEALRLFPVSTARKGGKR